jgi:hypothetical protein
MWSERWMVDAEFIEHRPFGLARCSTERKWEARFGHIGHPAVGWRDSTRAVALPAGTP